MSHHVNLPSFRRVQVKNAATLPALPNDKTLLQFLQPSFNVLSNIGRRQAHGQPLYAVGGIQRTAAEGFLTVRWTLRRNFKHPSRPSKLHQTVSSPPPLAG